MGKIQNNILLVEDEAIIALNQQKQLEKRGYLVTHAINGKKAVEIAKSPKHEIDLILMDINLGKGIDGTQAAERIQEFKEIPVVFLSSHTEPEVVEKIETITSYGYVVKNSGITVLDASIKMAFKLFDAHKDILKHKSDAENANSALESTVKNLETVNLSLTRLKKAIENTNEIVFITNREGIITYINPQFIKTYGYSKEEALGKIGPRDLGAEETPDEVDRIFWETLQNKQHLAANYINKTKSGKIITVEASIDPIFDNNGNLKEFVQIQRDITEKIQIERVLNENEEIFRGIFEQSTIGIYRSTPEGKILLANPSIISMLGYKNFEEIEKWDLNSTDFKPSYKRTEFLEKMEKENKITGLESEWIKEDGSKLYVRESAVAFRDEEGKIIYYQGMIEDISTKKQIELELIHKGEESKNYLDAIDSLDLGLFIVNLDYTVRYMNNTMVKWFGNQTGLICYKSVAGLEEPCPYCKLKEVLKEGKNVTYTPTTSDGRTFNIHGSLLQNSDGTVSKLEIIQDITELKSTHKHVETLLQEKEIILKEVHHRIKNNMMTIMGLLTFQEQSITDEKSIEAFENTRNRVQSMMVLYDKLYRSNDYQIIGIKEYFETLFKEIIAGFPWKEIISLNCDIEDIQMEPKIVFNLGIIINELITNSMKYAVDGNNENILSISASLSDNFVTLIVKDNGRGFPDKTIQKSSGGFGLELVNILSEQISADISFSNENGAKVMLRFRI